MAALREGRFDDVEVTRSSCAVPTGMPSRRSTPGPRACPGGGWWSIPTSWGSARCSRTCAGGSRRTGSRCALRSRSHDSTSPAPIPRRGCRWSGAMEDELQIGDLERAADHLVVQDDVTDVAVLGFCMGGMYTLKAAATGRFDRAVAFYGMIRVPDGWRGDALAEPLASAAAVCPTLAIFGDADSFTPAADIEALRGGMVRPARLRGRRVRGCRARLRPRSRPARAPRRRRGRRWTRTLAFLGVD